MTSEKLCKRVAKEWADSLMRLPNVVGLGVSHSSKKTGGFCIVAYVGEKVNLSRLNALDTIPGRLKVTSKLGNGESQWVPVEVVEVKGGFMAYQEATK